MRPTSVRLLDWRGAQGETILDTVSGRPGGQAWKWISLERPGIGGGPTSWRALDCPVRSIMPHVTDAVCEIDTLRGQGEQALCALFGRYRDRLLRMIAFRLDGRIIGKVDSEDVLQDVFLEAVRRLPRYLEDPAVPVFVWLRQLAGQILIDIHRKFLGARMRDVKQEIGLHWGGDLDSSTAFLASQLADSLTTPSQFAVRDESVAAVKCLLETLDPIDREVLVLRHLEELSNNEVAQVLGIDKFAASKRYLRALTRLRNRMPVES
jgi:RNA polymerase sigma-70 factor, ECF subfamily